MNIFTIKLNINMILLNKNKVIRIILIILAVIFIYLLFRLMFGSSSKKEFVNLKEKLKVYLIPHSHTDAGWWYTIDQYFDKNSARSTKRTLDSVLPALLKDEKRRFVYSDMTYFSRWYYNLSATEQNQVKDLIKTGRLEIVNGSWVMNDEAVTSYESILNQFRLGMNFLDKEFSYKPKTAWFIDTFGHSSVHVYFNLLILF